MLSKMGQHKNALEIYVFKLQDYAKAEKYLFLLPVLISWLLHTYLLSSRLSALPSTQGISTSSLPHPPHSLSPCKTNSVVSSIRYSRKAFASPRRRQSVIFDTCGHPCREVGIVLYKTLPEGNVCIKRRSNCLRIAKSRTVTNGKSGHEVKGEKDRG